LGINKSITNHKCNIHIQRDVHNFCHWYCHLYSSMMQQQMTVLAYLGSWCTKFHTTGWTWWFF
jgi:hypothetical protein